MKVLIKRFLLLAMFCFSVGVSINVYSADGIDLTKPNDNFGLVASISLQTGQVYAGSLYVVSGDHGLAKDVTSGGTFSRPFNTLNYAFQRSQASTRTAGGPSDGDLIVCMPGHTESINTPGGLDMDSEGTTVWCLGNGSNRGTWEINTTDNTGGTNANDVDVDAANISFYNGIFYGGTSTNVFDINADNFGMFNCETRDANTQLAYAGGPPVNWFATASGVDRFVLKGHTHYGTDTNEATQDPPTGEVLLASAPRSFVELIGGEGHHISHSRLDGNFDQPVLGVGTDTDTKKFDIHDLYVRNRNSNDKVGSTSPGSDGKWGPNIYARLADNAANLTEAIVLGGGHAFSPFQIVNANGEIAGEYDAGTHATGIPLSTDQ